MTGGAGGLGAATVNHLVGLGVGVAIFDFAANRAAELASSIGDKAVAVGGDVNDDDAVAAAIEAASSVGTLSIVVNVAGGGVGGGRTVGERREPHPLDSFARTMSLNAVGTFNVARLVAAAMATNRPDDDGQRGVLVHTASIAAMEGQAGQVAYAAAKAAIVGMTLPMARDLAPLGIRVCTIAPGLFDTPLLAALPEEARQALGAGIPHPSRLGRPEEYARMVAEIVANPMLNGETIRLDGALRMPPK